MNCCVGSICTLGFLFSVVKLLFCKAVCVKWCSLHVCYSIEVCFVCIVQALDESKRPHLKVRILHIIMLVHFHIRTV